MLRAILVVAIVLLASCSTPPLAPPPPPDTESFPSRSGARFAPEECCERPLVWKNPVYPRGALRRGQEGWVVLSGVLNDRAVVGNVIVLAAFPEGVFEKAAADAFRGWKYKQPRVVSNLPPEVRVIIDLRIPE